MEVLFVLIISYMFYSILWFKNLTFKIYNEIVDDDFRMFCLNFLIQAWSHYFK